MKINVNQTIEEVITAIADYIITIGQNAIDTRGFFNIVLSGGKSPELLYKKLSSKYKNKLNWQKVNFFFGDERHVPSNDPENNANMAKRILLDPLKIAKSQIFSINTSLSPNESAENYTKNIADHFKDQHVRFDLIILGLGSNAHTASLFPYTPVLLDKSASVQTVFLQEQKVYRNTMTATLINQARHIAFLVFGKDKAEAVRQVLEGEFDGAKYPAQLIALEHGEIHWFLDENAASALKT